MIKYNNLDVLDVIYKNRNKRLQSNNLKSVVFNVRVMQRRVSPAGCSNNVNAYVKDLDLALEQSRQREKDFDSSIKKEMNKLNYLKNVKKPRTAKIISLENTDLEFNSPRNIHEKNSSVEEIENLFKSYREKSYNCKTTFKMSTPRKLRGTDEFITRMSTPATKYFDRNNKPEIIKNTGKIEKLIDKCKKLSKDMKNTKKIKEKVQTQKKIEDADVSELITGKKRDNYHLADDKYMKNQLELDLQIAKASARGKKVWKLNHISYITTINRMINSVPMLKN